MFIAKYKDVPGTIGLIGTKLGEHDVNVGIMQLQRYCVWRSNYDFNIDRPCTK